MFKSLRARLFLSNLLPLSVSVLLMGITLVYVLETRFFIPRVTRDLEGIARVLAILSGRDARIWTDEAVARALLPDIDAFDRTIRIMFVHPDGGLFASSDPADGPRLGEILDIPGLAQARNGEAATQVNYSLHYQQDIVDVFQPVFGADARVIGIVRLSYHYNTVIQEFIQLRYLIMVVLFTGLLLDAGISSLLLANIQKPILRVTRAVEDLVRGGRGDPIPEVGSEETMLLARSINSLQARLHSLEQARSRLLSNLVHEMGRPLGALRVSFQAILRGAHKDPQVLGEMIAGMDEQAANLQRLLDDLTHLHDQVIGKLELSREPIHLAEWLPVVLGAWQASAEKKNLNWRPEIPADLPVVQADPDRLAQVIGNLVGNAIKFTSPHGTVGITAGQADSQTWIRVSDTGPGIPPEEQAEVFKPFFKGRQGKRFKQGMGLGLSLVRDLVLAHGGRLEVESSPGIGSRFTIFLPLPNSGTSDR